MELRFVNREGETLVFETIDGQRLRAELDDVLREAVRRTNLPVSQGVSPREVQAAIRSGESLAALAARLGVPEDTIEPFASPILDELRFVLQTALTTMLSSNDRMRSFRDLVDAVYPAAEFAIRKEDNQWILESGNSLKWTFDPKSRLIEPISAAAKELAKSFNTDREVIRPAKPVVEPRVVQAVQEVEPEPEEPESQGASVHDLVQELRARRNPEEIKPASAKGRASLPSWDEIVLGTGGLDPDANERDL
ncbi:MAG: hypothetical protein RL718_650 [Actinomycetota bacterium]|jgi:hypothetical protein